jgi:hypothetical protein
MHEHIVSWDIAKKYDRLAGLIFQRVPELIHDPDGKSRGIEYLNMLHIQQHVGMPYPKIGQTIVDLQNHKLLRGNSVLLIDQTGVGEAAVDIVRDKGANPYGIIISSGQKPNPIYAPAPQVFKGSQALMQRIIIGWTVPRNDLVTAGQVILQQGRLRIDPRIAGADAFREQLEAFRKNIKTNRYEAEEDSIHDDLVFAYLMAAWWLLQTKQDESRFDVPARNQPRKAREREESDTLPDWNPLALLAS